MSHQTILNNTKKIMSPLHVASIVYFDGLHLMTERSSHWRHSMFLKILRYSEENACAGVSAFGLIGKAWVYRIDAEAATGRVL